jgi:ABC-type sugar transport system ATPase subunit
VLGIAGLAGCGGAELLKVIAGELPALQGRMTLADAPYAPRSPREALRQGVAYLPGDRDEEGLLGSMSVRENIALSTLPASLRAVRPALERQTASSFVTSLGIKTPSVEAPVEGLSGGNRQKVVLAKLLATSPRLLLLDNPTRGVDVGARAQIYQAVARAAADGMSVVLLSEDLPELLGVADRLLVLRSGRPSHTFPDATELTEQDVLPHML